MGIDIDLELHDIYDFHIIVMSSNCIVCTFSMSVLKTLGI